RLDDAGLAPHAIPLRPEPLRPVVGGECECLCECECQRQEETVHGAPDSRFAACGVAAHAAIPARSGRLSVRLKPARGCLTVTERRGARSRDFPREPSMFDAIT